MLRMKLQERERERGVQLIPWAGRAGQGTLGPHRSLGLEGKGWGRGFKV